MKIPLYFLLLIFITTSTSAQSKQYIQYSSVKNGKSTSYTSAKKISAEEEISVADNIAKNANSITKNGDPIYEASILDYGELKSVITALTGQSFENKIFLIEYTYANDSCTGNEPWTKNRVKNRKMSILRQKNEIEKRNKEIVILNFFEEAITLANSPNSRKEYYFTDSNNRLRSSLFNSPTPCGSFALIRPTGETLAINGENSLWFVEQHLKPRPGHYSFKTSSNIF